jgi:hypothetical protein
MDPQREDLDLLRGDRDRVFRGTTPRTLPLTSSDSRRGVGGGGSGKPFYDYLLTMLGARKGRAAAQVPTG